MDDVVFFSEENMLQTVTEVMESIDFAFDTISKLQTSNFITEAACHSSSIGSQQHCLALAMMIRQSVTGLYEIDGELATQFAYESIENNSGLVFALEEEINKSENIIIRILDAVIDAFKWLLEKITSVFTSSETKEVASKKSTSLNELFSRVQKDMPELPNGGKISNNKVSTCFGYLGNTADLSTIEALLNQHAEYSKDLTEALLTLSPLIGKAKALQDSLKPDSKPEDISAALTQCKTNIDALLRQHLKTQYNANDHAKYGILKEGVAAGQGSYIVAPILTSRGPGAVGVIYNGEIKNNPASYTSKFSVSRQEKNASFELHLPAATKDLEKFISTISAVREKIAMNNDELRNKVSTMKADSDAMLSALNQIKNTVGKTGNKELSNSINAFSAYAKCLGAMFVALSSGQTAIAKVPDLYTSILHDVLSKSMADHSKAVKEASKEVKEGGSEETKK